MAGRRRSLHQPAGRGWRRKSLSFGTDGGGQPFRLRRSGREYSTDQENSFTVIGVLERKGQSPQGQDQDDAVFVPLRTAQRKLIGSQFPNTVGAVMVKA